MKTTSKTDVYQLITDSIIEKLEQGVIPWKSPYLIQNQNPLNFISKKAYRGINWMLLASSNFNSPYFLTFKQIKSLGGSVKSGAKSLPVVFWKILQYPADNQEQDKKIPLLKFSRVFNAEMIEGIVFPTTPAMVKREEAEILLEAEKIVAGMPDPPHIGHKNQKSAYYDPQADYVNMPFIQNIISDRAYYATLFHELVHATGHPSRLNRDLSGTYGSVSYSREELIAELGACFISSHLGLDIPGVENAAAYIQFWISKLKGDKKLIIEAAAKAQKATAFILNDHTESTVSQTIAA